MSMTRTIRALLAVVERCYRHNMRPVRETSRQSSAVVTSCVTPRHRWSKTVKSLVLPPRCSLPPPAAAIRIGWSSYATCTRTERRIACDGVLRASVRDGMTRQLVEPNAIIRYEISLWSTAMLFKAGHRLRVLLTSSDFPRYDRNPNTGELAHSATRFEPALQRIYLDSEHASHIILPVVAN